MNVDQREKLQEAEILLLMNRGDDEVCMASAELIHDVLISDAEETLNEEFI